MSTAGFASVILDVDSTLCGVEGVDWLAEQRGAATGGAVADLTERAMRGEIPLEQVYAERLALIAPTAEEIASLGRAYLQALAPGAESAIRAIASTGRRVVLVSGGLREAILPLAVELGLPAADVHAVSIRFGDDGAYTGFDVGSPLATASGKRAVAEGLALPRRIIAMGDGATDLAMRGAVDCFAAFTGFVRRDAVVASADVVLDTFDQLAELVLA